ncbi:MAG TPA: hypothetical protein VHX38_15675 [Pseudonocardiaceae bacterium]|nr:hypothetical protein [Pseudonocardiaceae bacterium]
MTEGPDPERLLAEALRAQAVSTPLPPAKPLRIDEPAGGASATPVPDAASGAGSGAGSGAEEEPGSFGGSEGARLVDLLSGAGHGLLSGRDPDTTDVPYSRRAGDNATGPVGTTRLNTDRAPLAWWWIVLLAVALGLACGAIAGVLSLV